MNHLRSSAFPALSRFGKSFLSAVGTVGGGLYFIGEDSTERSTPNASGYQVQARFRSSLCQVAAAGTVAWELVRGAFNPFASIDCQASTDNQGTPAEEPPEVTFAGKVATVLASLTVDSSCRDILLCIGGSFLVEWLIKHATEEEQGTIQQEKSQETLVNFLCTGQAGKIVLSHPRAVPQLLLQAASSSDSNRLTQALEDALESAPCPNKVPQGDIQDVLTLVKGRHGAKIQHMAMLFLSKWCEASVINCQMVASMGGGEVLSSVAKSVVGQGEGKRQMQCDLARLMCTLAKDCPSKSQVMMEGWISPLLYMLADASALQDPLLANSIVEAIGTCAASGLSQVQEALVDSNLWPLLRQFAGTEKLEFITSATRAIASLSTEGIAFPRSEFEHWTKQLLEWIISPETDDRLAALCSRALGGLACSSHADSLHVARRWLGEFIVALSESLPVYELDTTAPSKQVVPSYARYIAAEVQGLTSPSEGYSDPPDHVGESVLYKAGQALDWVEEDGDRGTPTSRALRVLCDLVADDVDGQKWLISKGLLPMMQRLVWPGSDGGDGGAEDCPPSVQEQITRLLAMVSRHRSAQKLLLHGGWVPWLEVGLGSSNIFLASGCSKALLHLRSDGPTSEAESSAPIFHDGIQLFDPTARHHWDLGSRPNQVSASAEPLVDVVFVHGIRGSAFVTWRKEDTERELSSELGSCWPSSWLAKDVPQARLLGLEYAAPVSRWEGESPPFKETAHALLTRLMDAGVGSRPLIFVAHSMGGIMVKEMLAHALQDSRNARLSEFLGNTQGLIFYSTPHHGTWLADFALNLKHIGASPAQSLNFLKPGPYLVELNRTIQEWSESKGLPILHFSESEPTKLLPVIPKLLIVPPESACPAFGESVRLVHVDHVRACKPSDKESISYSKTMELIRSIAKEVVG
ncbi:hypothetical protein BSKO_13001 [Bryopsis sp. KO-2023]|nr:hypothetical protein BSKO_13001 [Bryopsis sp. KO-2023]